MTAPDSSLRARVAATFTFEAAHSCHPDEAPFPCQRKYALSECLKSANASRSDSDADMERAREIVSCFGAMRIRNELADRIVLAFAEIRASATRATLDIEESVRLREVEAQTIERCAEIADGGARLADSTADVRFVTPAKYAGDLARDIADAIRALPKGQPS